MEFWCVWWTEVVPKNEILGRFKVIVYGAEGSVVAKVEGSLEASSVVRQRTVCDIATDLATIYNVPRKQVSTEPL